MRKMFFTLLLGVMMSSSVAVSQEVVHQIGEITVINYGDGRLLFREHDADKAPLNGKHRIINGYTSEYVLAEFKDGMYNGGYEKFKNNKLQQKSTYAEGRINGSRNTYFNDGTSINRVDVFVNGKLDGVSKVFYMSGKVESEKGYKLSVEHGVDNRYDSETGEATRKTSYLDGKRDGDWIEHMSSNRGDFTTKRSYNLGVPVGEFIETLDRDGSVREQGMYKDGIKNGLWVDNTTNPKRTELFKDGDVVELREFYTDGKLSKSKSYADGKLHGVTKEYFYDTGKLKSELNYDRGLEHGAYKRFYDDGTLKEEGINEKDSEVYRKKYYSNGKLEIISKRPLGGVWETVESYDYDGNKE